MKFYTDFRLLLLLRNSLINELIFLFFQFFGTYICRLLINLFY